MDSPPYAVLHSSTTSHCYHGGRWQFFLSAPAGSTVKPNPTTEGTQRAAGPNFFRDGENVQFMWADSLLGHTFSDDVLRLKVQTTHHTNRTTQTHDSVMHQFVTEENSFGELHLEICFVTEDIFRIRFAGQESTLSALTDDPEFPPPESRMLAGIPKVIKTTLDEADGKLALKSATIELRVDSKPFRLRAYRNGSTTPFWKQRLSDLFTSDIIPTSIVSHEGRQATYEAFTVDPQESLFGLGERFDGVERKGRPVDFVNHDAIGTSNTRTYINVPFFWSTNGYGCFVNSVARTEWDMAMSESGTVGVSTSRGWFAVFC